MNIEQIKQIVSMDSAYEQAKSALGIPRNMMVSNQLIIEMHDTIIAQAEEIERLRSFITRYRYQIKGGEAMQKHIDEKVLQAPKGEGEL